MNYNTVLQVLRLALRLAEVVLRRRAPKEKAAPTRADRVVARMAPLAERVLDRVSPETAPAGRRGRGRRRASPLKFARAAFFGAAAAGGAAYVVVRQQRRVRDRYRSIRPPFPEELLEVLAAPGGGGPLRSTFSGEGLSDPETGFLYPVVDGIPDFVASPIVEAEYLAGRHMPEDGDWLRLRELVAPLKPWALGINHAGNAALAGAVAASARERWVLSLPCGAEAYEIEMARANPLARIVCVDERWDPLLEARRRALEMGLANLYFVRGDPTLLPLQDAAVDGVWSANGFHLYPEPEQVMTQMARVAAAGAMVAGVSLVAGSPRLREALVRALARRLPGRRDTLTHFTLLAACGLRDLRAYRDGGFVRFSAVRA